MPEIISAAPHRILVIDDNSAIHEDFRQILDRPRGSDSLDALEADLFGEEVVVKIEVKRNI